MKKETKNKLKIFAIAIVLVLLYHNIEHLKEFIQGFIDGFNK